MFLVFYFIFLLYKGKHTRDPFIPLPPTRQEQHLSNAETEHNNSFECWHTEQSRESQENNRASHGKGSLQSDLLPIDVLIGLGGNTELFPIELQAHFSPPPMA